MGTDVTIRTRIKGLLAAFAIILGFTVMELFIMSFTAGH